MDGFKAMQLAGSSFLPRFIIIITFNRVILVGIIRKFCFYFDLLRFSGGSRCWLFCDTLNQPSTDKLIIYRLFIIMVYGIILNLVKSVTCTNIHYLSLLAGKEIIKLQDLQSLTNLPTL